MVALRGHAVVAAVAATAPATAIFAVPLTVAGKSAGAYAGVTCASGSLRAGTALVGGTVAVPARWVLVLPKPAVAAGIGLDMAA